MTATTRDRLGPSTLAAARPWRAAVVAATLAVAGCRHRANWIDRGAFATPGFTRPLVRLQPVPSEATGATLDWGGLRLRLSGEMRPTAPRPGRHARPPIFQDRCVLRLPASGVEVPVTVRYWHYYQLNVATTVSANDLRRRVRHPRRFLASFKNSLQVWDTVARLNQASANEANAAGPSRVRGLFMLKGVTGEWLNFYRLDTPRLHAFIRFFPTRYPDCVATLFDNDGAERGALYLYSRAKGVYRYDLLPQMVILLSGAKFTSGPKGGK